MRMILVSYSRFLVMDSLSGTTLARHLPCENGTPQTIPSRNRSTTKKVSIEKSLTGKIHIGIFRSNSCVSKITKKIMNTSRQGEM